MFVGRKDILADLETLWRKKTSSIVACRGRRRIGKSTLFREFAKRTADRYLEIEGLPPSEESKILTSDQLNQKQLDNFIDILSGMTGCSDEKVTNWFAAFKRLDEQIDETCRTVILLDEISSGRSADTDFTHGLCRRDQAHEPHHLLYRRRGCGKDSPSSVASRIECATSPGL